MYTITAHSKTVTEYALTLTEEQVAEVLVDHSPLQAQLRRLRAENRVGAGLAPARLVPARLGRRKNDANVKAAISPKDSSAKRATKKRPANVLTECPHCQKLVKGGVGLATHLRKAHPALAPVARS